MIVQFVDASGIGQLLLHPLYVIPNVVAFNNIRGVHGIGKGVVDRNGKMPPFILRHIGTVFVCQEAVLHDQRINPASYGSPCHVNFCVGFSNSAVAEREALCIITGVVVAAGTAANPIFVF